MKPDTYDIPAYKFAILVSKENIYSKNARDYFAYLVSQVNYNNVNTIPWENFDGLNVRDVLELTEQEHICLSCYVGWQASDICTCYNTNIRNTLLLDSSFLTAHIDEPIDKVVESAMMQKYNLSNSDTKIVYKCFFERYQDKSHEETLQRIQKLTNPTF